MQIISLILTVLVVVFIVSSLCGLFRAKRDIKKNKTQDMRSRPTRKDFIKGKLGADFMPPDLLNSLNNLSPQEQELFQRELLKKFNGE